MATQATCDNCGIPIHWQPTIVDGGTYCCLGCAIGGPCTCDYSRLPHVGESRAIVCQTVVIRLSAPRRDHRDRRPDAEQGPAYPGTDGKS